MKALKFISEAGVTRRFHTVPIIQDQNIADHSWHVAMIAWELYGTEEPGVTVPFVMACLTHDMAECVVGDLPAPAKRGMGESFPDFREKWGDMEQGILRVTGHDWEHLLSPEELRRLKLCDAMEGAMYCIRERMLGNKTIVNCFLNFRSYIEDVISKDDKMVGASARYATNEQRALSYIQAAWERAHVG